MSSDLFIKLCLLACLLYCIVLCAPIKSARHCYIRSLQVLRYYATHGGLSEGQGFVELRRSDYIADGPSQFLLHGSPVINDCIYRNMYRFRHILVVDYDEVCTRHSVRTFSDSTAVRSH